MDLKNMIIALDIDGTIARNDGKISPFTCLKLKELVKDGYTICLVTGRQWISTVDIYKDCNMNTLVVLCNGALVYDPINDKKIREISIPLEDIQKYVENEELMSHIEDMMCELDFNTYSLTGKVKWREQQIVGPFKENLYKCPNSFNIYAKSYEEQKEIRRLIQSNPNYDYRYWYLGGELYHVSFSKKEGVEELLKYYHKTMDDLFFIGDGENDIELLKSARISVAMANASPEEVKSSALCVTTIDNEHDGAVHYLLNLIDANKNGRN